MGTARRRNNTIKRMSLKINDRRLADGMYRSRHDRQSYQSSQHWPPPHRPPPRYPLQHPQSNEIFYEEELRYSTYQYDDLEDDYEDERMVYGRPKGFTNPSPNRRGSFSNPNRGDRFPNSFHGKERGYSNPGKFRIPSFDGNLNIRSSLLWIDKVDKLFDMGYIFIEDQVVRALKQIIHVCNWFISLSLTVTHFLLLYASIV